MNEPDLDNTVNQAQDCGVKIDEIIALTALKTDEDKLVFWAIFFVNAVAAAVNQTSQQTTLIILNSLITAIHNDEIKSNFH